MPSTISSGGDASASFYRDAALSAVVSMSSEHGSYPKENATDGTGNTMAATVWGTPPPHWYQVDLGAATLISRWAFVSASYSDKASGNFTVACELQYYNGTTWVTVDTVTGNTKRALDRAIVPVSAQLWRLYITNAGPDSLLRMYQFSVYERVTA